MYSRLLVGAALALSLVPRHTSAQVESRRYRVAPPADGGFQFFFGDDDTENRAVIGVTTSGGSVRDTLGVLVSSVASGGPAERAGIEEGNRLASINGVNLRLAAADAGDPDMSGIMTRRLTRELGKVRPGDDVELKVYSGGQIRSARVRTTAYDSLYRRRMRMRDDDGDDRAVLGVSLGSSGSRRDTLGVLVMWLDDDGPAVKAGILEGNRIAAINGVDVRVRPEDAGDDLLSNAKVERVRRELAKLHPGDEVELRLYADGRTRTVRVKTVAASTLSDHSTFMEPGAFLVPRMEMRMPMPPAPPAGVRSRMRVSTLTSM